MKSVIKNSMRTLVDVAIGGVAMQAVGNSSMPQGFKDATNVGIGAGIMGRSLKRSGFGGKKSRW
jgi:hypothetical protein